MGSIFISSDVGEIEVGGLTWRQVDTSNLRFNGVDGFAWLSRILTFSSRRKLHNPERRRHVIASRSFSHVMLCSTTFSLSFHRNLGYSVSFM